MEDLLQSQILESCRLALPNGLKELMCDISREVLRAQPKNVYGFIANYLSALLVTRENLTIAATVCREACGGSCCPELEDELRDIGLFEDDIEQAKTIIVKYFNRGAVNEVNLLMTLIKRTNILEDYLPAVQDAVRRAFMRHQKNYTVIYESSSESEKDEVALAARHTLQLYRKTRPVNEMCNHMVEKVQASYRAYGVKRTRSPKGHSDVATPYFKTEETVSEPYSGPNTEEACPKISLNTVSSSSLAGSYLRLPKYVPYSALDPNPLLEFEEGPEKEHANIDYTQEYVTIPTIEINKQNETKIVLNKNTKDGKRRISFGDLKYTNDNKPSEVKYAEGLCFELIGTENKCIETDSQNFKTDHAKVAPENEGEETDTEHAIETNNEGSEIDDESLQTDSVALETDEEVLEAGDESDYSVEEEITVTCENGD